MEVEYLGCGSNSCKLEKPTGQGTNSQCTCFSELPSDKRIRLEKFLKRELSSESLYERFLFWRGIETKNACFKCEGTGKIFYANTTTWVGGIGGQALTLDVCNECWGSGDLNHKGADLKKLIKKCKES